MKYVIYKYHYSLTPEQVQNIENEMSPGEQKLLHRLDITTHDEEGEDGNAISYMIGEIDQFFPIDCFLTNRNISYIKEDISYKTLVGKYSFIDTPIEEKVDEFIDANLTVDIILDKINYSGIESLTLNDKMVLESF